MRNYLRKVAAKRGTARGMTLIEIMVVVFILGLIATVIAVNVGGVSDTAKIETAKLDIKGFEQALDLYMLKKGSYPSAGEGLNVLYSEGILKGSLKKDPWGRDYVYLYPGQKNPKGFDLYSYGSSGTGSETMISGSN